MRFLCSTTAAALCLFMASAARGQSAQLDPTFHVGAGPDGVVRAIVLLTDGTMLVGGHFSSWNGEPRGSVVRLNSDGTLDSTFGTDLQMNVEQLFVLHDRVVAVGNDSILRLLHDGRLDTNFAPRSVTGPVAATEDYLYTVFVPPRPFPVLEVRAPDGTLINTPYVGSVGDDVHRLVAHPGNRVFMVGHFHIGVMPLFGPSGQSGFQLSAPFPFWGVHDAWNVAIAPDGSLYAALQVDAHLAVYHLGANGLLDTNFAPVMGTIPEFNNMAVQSDGRLLHGSGTLTRLNLDGAIDATFNPNFSNSTIHAIAVQPDGMILVGGSIDSVDGQEAPNIVRLAPVDPAPIGFAITGRVTDGTNGVAGVRVKISRRNSTFTDETGTYTLAVRKRGVYFVRPSLARTRFAPQIRRVRVREDVVIPDFVVRRRR